MADIIATFKTNKWDIKLKLFHKHTPKTVANFINLAQRWFYNDLNFHRVIENFMIQGGCPLWTGTWWPWYNFEDEFHQELRHNKPGMLSMANSWPASNGSQFFITHVETPWLDDKHTIFGEVLTGLDQDIVNAITQNDKIEKVLIEWEIEQLLSEQAEIIKIWNTILDKKN
jgi:peptidyl-prolyl cis-trans isomerase B (cyclophilin B)